MGVTTTTNRSVRMHGWTLPKGTQVQVSGLFQVPGTQQPSASCTTRLSGSGVGLPISALADRDVLLAAFDVEAI